MSIKGWLLDRIHDHEKDAELTERERRTHEVADALRAERERNGFGEMFTVALNPPKPRKHKHKKGLAT